jgi:hypothetical protein
MYKNGVVRRALELARGGECRSLIDIRRALKQEQYLDIDAHLAGRSLQKQLTELMKVHAADRWAGLLDME